MNNIIKILVDCGFNIPLAKMTVYFINNRGKHVSSRDIERGADCRQPEVSHGLVDLMDRKWIAQMDNVKNEGKGRPIKTFMIVVSNETIVADIELGFRKDIKRLESTLTELRAAMIPGKTVQGESSVKKEQQLKIDSP